MCAESKGATLCARTHHPTTDPTHAYCNALTAVVKVEGHISVRGSATACQYRNPDGSSLASESACDSDPATGDDTYTPR